MRTKLHHRIFAFFAASIAVLGLFGSTYAYSVYRRVTADTTTGAVAWTAANFGVSGNPATLSFFYYATDAVARARMPTGQCLVRVDLPNTATPGTGATDQVGNNAIAVGGNPNDQPKAFPWTIGFDNTPSGHWSILKTQITSLTSNNAASRVSASGFHNLALTANSGVTVINGTLANCIP